MAKKNFKKDNMIQRHVDRWADLMMRIVKNPEIADRIPDQANLLFGEGDLIFINGEPRRYSELVKVRARKKAVAKSRRQEQIME